MKKLIALVLALALVLASCAVAFAGESDYTITIDNAVDGETYTAYKIFDVTYSGTNSSYTAPAAASDVPGSADPGSEHTAYSYSISSDSAWFSTVTNSHNISGATANTSFTENGLTFTKTTTDKIWNVQAASGFNAATFATVLNAAKNGKPVAATKTAVADGANANMSSTTDHGDYITGTITLGVGNSGAGYYFVDTGLGALCSLDTTESNALIRDKNSIPGIDKTVSDSASGTYGATTDVNIGDRVYYKIEVTDGTGTDSQITVHDTLSPGQTLEINSFVVEDDDTNTTSSDLTYTVTYNSDTSKLATTGTAAAHVESGNTGNESFTIVFPATYVGKLDTGKKITITYSAILNDAAVIAGDGNPNTASLTYSNQDSQEHTTIVYTYVGALYKFNAAAEELSGAEFTMVNSSSAPMYFKQVYAGSSTAPTVYRYNSSYTSSTADATNTLVTPESGAVLILGLDVGSYTLTETKAPTGYNKLTGTLTLNVAATHTALTENVNIPITNGSVANAIFQKTKHDTNNTVTYQVASTSVLGIQNNAGTELPSTGGIGTTIFYILGGLLVIGAAVILVARRKAHE